MAELPPQIEKILEEETDFQSPVSEALKQKIGSTINGLIDMNSVQQLTGSGTFTVPEGVTTGVFVFAAGGGGGGGGGGVNIEDHGAPGGEGSQPTLQFILASSGDEFNFNVGSGGAGGPGSGSLNDRSIVNGDDGQDTTFGPLVFPGGIGGKQDAAGSSTRFALPFESIVIGKGAGGGPSLIDGLDGDPGKDSKFGSGGRGGNGDSSNHGGGGGGAGWQDGGRGGDGDVVNKDGVDGGISAGGGGGATRLQTNTNAPKGGDGGDGIMWVFFK